MSPSRSIEVDITNQGLVKVQYMQQSREGGTIYTSWTVAKQTARRSILVRGRSGEIVILGLPIITT